MGHPVETKREHPCNVALDRRGEEWYTRHGKANHPPAARAPRSPAERDIPSEASTLETSVLEKLRRHTAPQPRHLRDHLRMRSLRLSYLLSAQPRGRRLVPT